MDTFRKILTLFLKNFDTIFVGNIKSSQKNKLFFFFHKKFLKIFLKLILLGYPLTFPLN